MKRSRALLAVLRALSAELLRRPWTALVAFFGVALGTSVVVAIDLAAHSAEREHEQSLTVAAAGATHRVLGGPGGVPEALYRELVMGEGVRRAAARIERDVRLAGDTGRRVLWRGLDLLAEAPPAGLPRESMVRLLTEPASAVVGNRLARELGIASGASLRLLRGEREIRVEVIGVLQPDPGSDDVLLSDIASLQEAAGRHGFVDRIDLVASARLPPSALFESYGARLVTIERRIAERRSLSSAFKTNLRMMGLLALLVGLLLVYNAQSFSVVQRRERLGVLRALGATRLELGSAVLCEALLLGLVAGVAGVAMGLVLASLLLGAVEQTLNDLYFQVRVDELALSAPLLAKAMLLAVGGTMVSALPPAIEAATEPPATVMRRSTMESAAARRLPWLALASLVLLSAAGLLMRWPAGGLTAGYAALFLVVGASVLLVPACFSALLRLAALLLRSAGIAIGALALSTMRATASRSAVAVAALCVALAATIGVDTMISSFRLSVAEWLKQTLRADFYVSEPGSGTRAALPEALVQQLVADPRVAAVSRGRSGVVQARHGDAAVVALDLAPQGREGFRILAAAPGVDVWPAFESGAVLISESYAYRQRKRAGDTLELLAGEGWRPFPIAGIYRDYSRESGVVLMSGRTWREALRGSGTFSLGLYLRPGADTALALADMARAAAPFGVNVRPSAELRAQSLAIFDRTFAVTEVLKAVTVVVAFAGVLSVLLALQLERAREVALLRASGATRAEVAGSVLVQTLMLGASAGVLALPVGAAIGYLLVTVINTRSFGWTLDFVWNWGTGAQSLGLAAAAATLAGVVPAWRLGARPVAAALRYE